MEYKISVPASEEELKKLCAGDSVLLSGTVYTARDAAHKRICECFDNGEPAPFELSGSAIYYVGPTPEHDGCCIGSAGPTTSGRMDAYSPRLLDAGLKIMIGKGNRSDAVVKSMIKNGAVYLAAIGGAGALMAASIEQAELVCWADLGCEAVRRLTVKDMPLTVAIDSQGNDLYKLGREQYLKEVEKIMDYAKKSLELHYELKGKIEVASRTKANDRQSLSLAYTPGVAAPCLEIQKDVNKKL